jgi:hypothetical protein
LATDGRYDPLPDISAQVQNQICDRIALFGAAPPNLVRGQELQTMLDAAFRLTQLLNGIAEEKAFHLQPEYKIRK